MRIRRHVVGLVIGVFLLLSLAGCGARDAAGTGLPDESSERKEPDLPEVTWVLIGTFRLEETELAVSSEQASELLPLWKAYRALSDSDSAAPEEREALVRQIRRTMDDEQMAAVDAMALGQGDLAAVMEQQGLTLRRQGGEEPDGEAVQSGARGGFEGAPGGMGGGFPGGGGPGEGAWGSGELPAEAQTRVAERVSAGPMVNPGLIEALIALLEAKQ